MHTSSVHAIERVFYVKAVEYKGKVHTKREAFPKSPLQAESGMKIKKTDANGVWSVEAYSFEPSQLTVYQDDLVILHFIGINGAIHNISIEGVKATTLTRGTMTTVRFIAKKTGIIPFTCFDHQPNMNGQIAVLPKQFQGRP